ncbi:heterokaryon incompatibility protein-domain-containing protein [Lasiosphaeris hirsuta]|uniref:Heterokaryon incompatibility protein-domain-containing protein n=1 Tax=Lasiosphaeris hirsuta TaxID=260670 RepID=A0AA40ARB1_9PEZI|nr:heterokaryon incompatibility protein-domain-containing protein [Lasiosphaeris hirsuta]
MDPYYQFGSPRAKNHPRQRLSQYFRTLVKLAFGHPCPVCQSLNHSPPSKRGLSRIKAKGSVPAFQGSRDAGCKVCRMALDAVKAFQRGWNNTLQLWLDRPSLPSGGAGWDTLTVFLALDDPVIPRFKLKGPLAYSTSIIADTRTDEAFRRVSSWLEDCLSKHDGCKTVNGGFMPSRVLDLRLADEYKLILVPTSRLQRSAAYACLSYCWGSDLDGVATTVKANVQAHQLGISLMTLPRTIRDAVMVAQKLAIRYLWVDALCIIQDDGDDWARESARMCDIYSNSKITIAAHRATSCKDGFLGEQIQGQPSWQREFKTKFGKKYPNASSRNMLLRLGHPPMGSPSPLDTRGWALQECILPRRVVHYTDEELIWECNTRHFCECGHVEGPQDGGETRKVKTQIRKSGGIRGGNPNPISDPTIEGWMQLVERYTERRLTYSSDRLVAVVGLAQMVQASSTGTMDSEYLAGLFRKALPRHLLWIAGGNSVTLEGALPRPLPPRAPSWSWASIDGRVHFPGELHSGWEDASIVIDHDRSFCYPTKGAAHDPTVTGELLLEGLAAPVKLITVEARFDNPMERHSMGWAATWMDRLTYVWAQDGSRTKVACDTARDPELRFGDKGHGCWISDDHRCNRCKADSWDLGMEYCVLKVATYYNEAGSPFTPAEYFLVLQRSVTVKGAWERIGLGEIKLRQDKAKTEGDLFREAKTQTLRIV